MAIYSDLDAQYSPKNTRTKPVAYNLEDIKRSLLRLFSTRIGSVPFNRNYGSHLYNMLFENNLNLHDVRMFLFQDIQQFEPRVTLSPMDIYIEQTDEHTYRVSVAFAVPELGVISNVNTDVTDQG